MLPAPLRAVIHRPCLSFPTCPAAMWKAFAGFLEPLSRPPVWGYSVCKCKKVTVGLGKGRRAPKPPLRVRQAGSRYVLV